MNRFVRVFAFTGLLGVAAGCGSAPTGPVMVPVTGTVTLDGKPLPQGVVTLLPSAGGRAPSATTDDQGKFQVESIAGDHKVAVSKVEVTGGPPPSADGLAPDFATAPQKVKAIVPERYNRPDTSALTVKVPDGGGDVGTIPLTLK